MNMIQKRVVRDLAAHGLYEEARRGLARDLVPILAADQDPQVRAQVSRTCSDAYNEDVSAIPLEVLRTLASDPDPGVREAVAYSNHPGICFDLLADPCSDVRAGVAYWGPRSCVRKLRRDKDPEVQKYVAWRDNEPKWDLSRRWR